MARHYNYNWSKLGFILIALMILFFYVIFVRDDLSSGTIIFFAIMTAYTVITHLMAMHKVTLTDTHITIDSPIPFKKPQHLSLSEIKAYTPLKVGKNKLQSPFGGKLTPNTGAQILFMASGTINFDDLNERLSAILPSLPLQS